MYGVPWELVSQWDEDEVDAALIICGQYEGGEFDWDSMSWRKPKDSM